MVDTIISRHRPVRKGFALPTVIIVSLVMMSVLAVAVQTVDITRNTLNNQYYSKLAQTAAEAGISYAQACMAANNNQVTWSDSTPLKPNTDCTGAATTSCVNTSTDPNCWVAVNTGFHTNFSVGAPIQTAGGDAMQISSQGTTSLIRTSNGIPWRDYNRSQTLRYANNCSSTLQNTPGWGTPVLYNNSGVTTSTSFPTGTGAQQIAFGDGTSYGVASPPGSYWYRKDLNITTPGTYVLRAVGDDRVAAFVDGNKVIDSRAISTARGWDVLEVANANLGVGCHTIMINVLNNNYTANGSNLTASLTLNGASSPLVVTDTTWRVKTGDLLNFSDYRAQIPGSTSWYTATDVGVYNSATPASIWGSMASWTAGGGDPVAEWITAPGGNTGSAPANSGTYLLDRQSFTTTNASTQVTYYTACDDICYIYLDGNQVGTAFSYGADTTATVTVGPGTHRFGVILANVNAGYSAFLFSAKYASSSTNQYGTIAAGTRITYSGLAWQSIQGWPAASSLTALALQVYDPTYVPDGLPATNDTVANIAPNSSFESDISGYSPYNDTLTQSTAWADNGTHSLAITPNGSSTDTFASINTTASFQPGYTYTMTGTVHIATVPVGSFYGGRPFGLYAGWIVGGSGVVGATVLAPPVPGTYRLTMTFTVPTGASGIIARLYNGSNSASDVVYWDNVQISQSVRPYW